LLYTVCRRLCRFFHEESAEPGAARNILLRRTGCYSPINMRPSAIWFVVAALWLIDVILAFVKGHGKQALLSAAVAFAFVLIGVIHRRRETAALKPLR